MRKINQLKMGALLSYVNLGISCLIPLIYTPVMLEILGQNEYGLYSLSQSVISYLSLLTFGMGSAIVRYVMKYRTDNDHVMVERVAGLFVMIFTVISLIVCCVGIGLTFVSGKIFAKGLTDWETQRLNVLIIIMTFSTAVSFLTAVYSSICICYERYIFRRLTDMFGTVAAPVFNLIMLYAGYASVGMAVAGMLIQIITLVLNVWYCYRKLNIHPRFRNLPFGLLKEVFAFSAIVFLSSIADLLYWSTDKVLLGAMTGSAAVAVYNVGGTFSSMLQNMAGAISGVFSPRVNTIVFNKRPIEEISELMIRVGRIQYLVVSLILSGYIVFGKAFIIIWAGKDYAEAYGVALLTMLPLAIPLIQNIAYTAIVAQNRHQFRSILYIVLAVLNVIGTYVLIPKMGIIGAALCTCVVFVLGHGIIMNGFYYKKIGLDIPKFWNNILRMSIVPAGMICFGFCLMHFGVNFEKTAVFIGGVLLYTIIFCCLSWIFSMNEYERHLIIDMLKKRKSHN